MRTMYVPGLETHVHSDYIIGHHHIMLEINNGKVLNYIKMSVTPGFKGTKPGASHTCAKKTTYIITECIEINIIKHQSTYYIAEVLLQNKIIKIKRTKDRRRQCRQRHAT
jgi:hypothetical protein